MKKRISILLIALMVLTLLISACAAASEDSTSAGESWNGSDNGATTDDAGAETEPGAPSSDEGASLGEAGTLSTSMAEKIIYSANVEMETLDFDETIAAVEEMVERYGGFFESSSVSGNSYSAEYYGYTGGRYANYVIRVPVESFDEMTGSLDTVGNVLNVYRYTENITTQFYDSQSRLDAYEIEEERLLSMLEQAETVTDMLDIESRLSQVRYEIEALETRLRNWQNQVDYSTVELNIREVRDLTERQDPDRTYLQQLGDGFASTLKDVGGFFKDLFRIFVASIPVLIIIAVVIVAVVLIIRRVRRRRRQRDNVTDTTNDKDGGDKD